MQRLMLVAAVAAVVGVFVAAPVAVVASHQFTDVPDGHTFHADIEWMADNGITFGCGSGQYCPQDEVTRGQMAAFMKRLATNRVVDAATAVNADNADSFDGENSEAFLKKVDYDANEDGVVESAEVKIRYKAEVSVGIDIGASLVNRMRCVTSPVTLDSTTTVVASGGLTLDPVGTNTDTFFGFVWYTIDGITWFPLTNTFVTAQPEDGTGPASIPINEATKRSAGTYQFAILPVGTNFQGGDDYTGWCQLTVTAYTGLGPTTDVILN